VRLAREAGQDPDVFRGKSLFLGGGKMEKVQKGLDGKIFSTFPNKKRVTRKGVEAFSSCRGSACAREREGDKRKKESFTKKSNGKRSSPKKGIIKRQRLRKRYGYQSFGQG